MKVPNSTITERIGVYYTGYVFSLAGVIFRETTNTDVGIDAQIELINDNGHATGKLAGIQIKSGDSFVDLEDEVFTLRSEKRHFEYWKDYTLPVIGVVYSPTLNKAVWILLSKEATGVLEANGPYKVAAVLNQNNELNASSINNYLIPFLKEHYGMPVNRKSVEILASAQKEVGEEVEDKEIAWKLLINVLLASDSPPDVLADAGYRISWYFPTVNQSQKDFFIDRLSYASDDEITRIVAAVHFALSEGADQVGELIGDLLHYLPDNVERLKSLGMQRLIPVSDLEALFQLIEFLSQEPQQHFRIEIMNLYGVSGRDLL